MTNMIIMPHLLLRRTSGWTWKGKTTVVITRKSSHFSSLTVVEWCLDFIFIRLGACALDRWSFFTSKKKIKVNKDDINNVHKAMTTARAWLSRSQEREWKYNLHCRHCAPSLFVVVSENFARAVWFTYPWQILKLQRAHPSWKFDFGIFLLFFLLDEITIKNEFIEKVFHSGAVKVLIKLTEHLFLSLSESIPIVAVQQHLLIKFYMCNWMSWPTTLHNATFSKLLDRFSSRDPRTFSRGRFKETLNFISTRRVHIQFPCGLIQR